MVRVPNIDSILVYVVIDIQALALYSRNLWYHRRNQERWDHETTRHCKPTMQRPRGINHDVFKIKPSCWWCLMMLLFDNHYNMNDKNNVGYIEHPLPPSQSSVDKHNDNIPTTDLIILLASSKNNGPSANVCKSPLNTPLMKEKKLPSYFWMINISRVRFVPDDD